MFSRFAGGSEGTAWLYRALSEVYAAAPAGLLPHRGLAELDRLARAIEEAAERPSAATSAAHDRLNGS